MISAPSYSGKQTRFDLRLSKLELYLFLPCSFHSRRPGWRILLLLFFRAARFLFTQPAACFRYYHDNNALFWDPASFLRPVVHRLADGCRCYRLHRLLSVLPLSPRVFMADGRAPAAEAEPDPQTREVQSTPTVRRKPENPEPAPSLCSTNREGLIKASSAGRLTSLSS